MNNVCVNVYVCVCACVCDQISYLLHRIVLIPHTCSPPLRPYFLCPRCLHIWPACSWAWIPWRSPSCVDSSTTTMASKSTRRFCSPKKPHCAHSSVASVRGARRRGVGRMDRGGRVAPRSTGCSSRRTQCRLFAHRHCVRWSALACANQGGPCKQTSSERLCRQLCFHFQGIRELE